MIVVRRDSGTPPSVAGVLVVGLEDLTDNILLGRVFEVVVNQSAVKVRVSAVCGGFWRGFDDLKGWWSVGEHQWASTHLREEPGQGHDC